MDRAVLVAVVQVETPVTEPVVPHAGGRLPLWAAVALAAAAGVLLLVAFPPYGVWWTAPLGVAAFALAVRDRRARVGFGLGALAGAVLFTPLLSWSNLHTGAVPWLLLSALQALYVGLLGAATAAVRAVAQRWRWSWPPLVAVLWSGQEALRDRTPFGGFPWGRLAFSQDDSPLLRLAALGGAPLVTFAVALCGGFVAVAVAAGPERWREVRGGRWRPAALLALGSLLAPGLLLLGAWLVPLRQADGPAAVVAVVQGNVPRLGLDFNEQRRAVLDNHVRGTVELAGRVARGEVRRPDLVVWPENASDIDPLRNADAATAIDTAARAIGAPILVGAVLSDPRAGVENAGLVWTAERGAVDKYVKRHPVPFAESMPSWLRGIAVMISDDAARVGNMVPGDRPGVLRVGPATVGDVICFEVAYDDIVRDTVDGGAQLLAVQTNNATFNEAEARQQLAMVRLRAVEHGRDALMASTVGISGFVDATGRSHDETRFNEAAVVVRELHLGSARTLATRVGPAPEYVIVMVALAALVLAGDLRRRGRRPASAQTKEDV